MNKPLILVVEDDAPVRSLITTTLRAHDYRFLSAANGESAILEASSHNPDIMLLDLGLPDIDGMEVLRQIRQKSDVPIIVVSARGQEFCLDYFRLDFEKRKLYVHDQEVHLTPLEYKMMVLLVNNSGKVLTHHYIQQEVWGYDTTDDYQSLRVFMANIRRKIEDNTANPRFILTEVGVGYRFVDE